MKGIKTYEGGGQRLRIYPTGFAYLDYDWGPTERWCDEAYTDVKCSDYRKTVQCGISRLGFTPEIQAQLNAETANS